MDPRLENESEIGSPIGPVADPKRSSQPTDSGHRQSDRVARSQRPDSVSYRPPAGLPRVPCLGTHRNSVLFLVPSRRSSHVIPRKREQGPNPGAARLSRYLGRVQEAMCRSSPRQLPPASRSGTPANCFLSLRRPLLDGDSAGNRLDVHGVMDTGIGLVPRHHLHIMDTASACPGTQSGIRSIFIGGRSLWWSPFSKGAINLTGWARIIMQKTLNVRIIVF